jgi:hypothetical protein
MNAYVMIWYYLLGQNRCQFDLENPVLKDQSFINRALFGNYLLGFGGSDDRRFWVRRNNDPNWS